MGFSYERKERIIIKTNKSAFLEIERIKKKAKINQNTSNEEVLSFYFKYFYHFILKEARMIVINDIYERLKILKKDLGYSTIKDTPSNIEAIFRQIANLIHRTAPDKSNSFFMMDQYLKLLVPGNDELNQRLIKEIESIMFLVNKFTQLYYQGDGRGSISYVNLYGELKDA